MQPQSYSRGVLYAFLGGVSLSLGGLLVRFVEDASPWTILFYRSLTFSLTVVLFMLLRGRGKFIDEFRAVKPSDLFVSLLLAMGFITYVLSLFNTTVANTVLILTTGPMFAGLLGFVFLRERISRITWLAIALALIGVTVMVSGGINAKDSVGILYAIGGVVTFACFVVSVRYFGAERDMMPSIAIAGIVAALMCVPFLMSGAGSWRISNHDLTVAMLLGSAQVGLGFIFITLASRSVPSAQVPLLTLSETALSPLWVWLAVNEVPAKLTIVGGAVVLVAVCMQAFSAFKSRR